MMTKTQQQTISAIIVTYQSDLQRLKRAVDSLRMCSYPIEINIIDNDSGASYRADLSRSFPDIRIIDSGINKGYGAGHNLGFAMRKTESDYHVIVNPDIRFAAGELEKIVDFMQTRQEIGLATPKIVSPSGELQYLCKRKPNILALFGRRFLPKSLTRTLLKNTLARYEMRDKDYEKIIEAEFLPGCFMVFRSDIFKKIEGFDERFFLYFEDADITLRAREVSKAVHFPRATVIHDWQGGAHSSNKLTCIMLISALKFFRKWGVTWW